MSDIIKGKDGAQEMERTTINESRDDNAEVIEYGRKRRKLTSHVWLEFEKIKSSNGVDKAICNHCRKSFTGSSTSGTSHLKNHLLKCPLRNYVSKGQNILQTIKEGAGENPNVTVKNFKFDQEKSRLDMARMVMKHNYPFNMVEHELFQTFVSNLQPSFKVHCRNTLRADVLKVYKLEKSKLYKLLDELPSRVSLTTDMWTCGPQKIAYCCLTAHFIDDNWVLRKKILAFANVESRHDGESLFDIIKGLLLEWNIEKKICSLTVDNAIANDVMTRELRAWICEQSSLPLSGDIFHVRCAAHILNLIVQDGYKVINGLLQKIRDSVSYVNSSPQRKQQFQNVLSQLKLENKSKPGDHIPNRWNSTYLMLESALGLKEAFFRLQQVDRNFKANPSKEEWEIGEIVCKCLEVFYDATCKFSSVTYTTSNIYFPIVCGIQRHLMEWEEHRQLYVQDMTDLMKDKFNKYWKECSLVMALGVILDPRYKLDVVEYFLNEIYGISAENQLLKIRTALAHMFHEYKGNVSSYSLSVDCDVSDTTKSHGTSVSSLQGFKKWYEQTRAANVIASRKFELDKYLEEPIVCDSESDKFDILSWWQDNAPQFPILGKMARDILAIPISTVASESAFSIGGNVIEPSHHALGVDIVQALICGQDWIELSKEKVSRRVSKTSTMKSKSLI